METVKIVHCADLHLGSPFAGFGRRAAIRRADLLQTFRRILAVCREQQAQLLLVAGDLFDSGHPSRELVEAVRDGFSALDGVTVAIAPGNHDPMAVDSPYALEDFWPENVHIFCGEMQPLMLDALGVCLWGAAFTGAYGEQPMLHTAQPLDEHLIHIGVLHGTLTSGEQTPYGPITTAEIAASGLDYLALGHIHACSGVQRIGRTFYAYPGCPEGRGFDELGQKGVLTGEVGHHYCTMDFLPTARRQYFALEVALDDTTRTEIESCIRAAMQKATGETWAEQCYKVTLTGTPAENAAVDIARLTAELADVFYIKFRNETRLAVDLSAESDDFSLRGIFLRRMAEKLNSGNEAAELALRLGLRALTEEVKYHVD